MPLSEFEISKITEIVAGKVGAKLDAKTLRHVIDAVIDNIKKNQANPEIKGAICDAESKSQSSITEPDKKSEPVGQDPCGLDKKSVGRNPCGFDKKSVGRNPLAGFDKKEQADRSSASGGLEPDKKHLINQMPTSNSGSEQPNKILPPDEQLVPNEGGLYEQIEKTDATRVIIAAFGKNRPGIVAAITKVLADLNCSIEDISQTIMQEFFSMIMIVDIKDCPLDFSALRDKIKATETQLGMQVFIMHEDIFRYMHRI